MAVLVVVMAATVVTVTVVMVGMVAMAMVMAAMVVMKYRVEDAVLVPVIMAAAGITVDLLEEMGSRMWCWIDSRAAPVGG